MAEPNEETVKTWTEKSWYNHTVITKYYMLNPTAELPHLYLNPFV